MPRPHFHTIRPPVRERRRGFSLVELVAVIALAAILAAVAVPSLNAATDARAKAAARMLLRDLTQARERAVATGVPVWITFDTAAQMYSVSAENPAAPGRAGAVLLVDPTSGKASGRAFDAAEFAGVRLLSVQLDGGTALGFDWLGRPLSAAEVPLAGAGRITLTGGHAVTVEPGSGLAAHIVP